MTAGHRWALAGAFLVLLPMRAPAQVPPTPQDDRIATALAGATATAVATDQPAALHYSNRFIVEYRATVLTRPPQARAAAAVDLLNRLVDEVPGGRVTSRTFDQAVVLFVGTHPVIALFAADADALADETLDAKAASAVARLQVALDEATELRTPRRLIRGLLLALGATALYALALWILIRIERRVAARLALIAERSLKRLPGGEVIVGVARAPAYVSGGFKLAVGILGVLLTYSWISIVLRQLPYTRPWGESLHTGLVSVGATAGRAVMDALPNLMVVLAIVIVVRALSRLTTAAFRAVEEGRVTLPGVYQETAQPTRRIAVALLWIFALVVSYEYLPGSGSDAFKGASVFVGLVVSLGSTGIMNQVMSGLMVTYSRALRRGDFVKVGEVEGVVTHLGTLSTKIKNARNEEITIPNAIVVAQATTNYSRYAELEGVYVPTSVTIGYDAPWRQVQALLLLAAQRTPGVRPAPQPVVLQAALDDFYVRYTLLVCLEQPSHRYRVLGTLHANIQDAFNEYGVQIMSPNYEADPGDRKVVPPARWYASPAAPPADRVHDSGARGEVEAR